ncbi:MAG: hypothetical protein JWP11_1156 [Frankiales bacterium]|nr:hypothetical protein [Frankiales bacterium]
MRDAMTSNTISRVALLAQEYSLASFGGGLGSYTHYLAQGLHEMGVDVTVFGRDPVSRATASPAAGYRAVVTRPWTLPARIAAHWPAASARVEAAVQARLALRPYGPFDVIEGPDWLGEGGFVPRSKAAVHARHVHGSLRAFRSHAGWIPQREHRLAEWWEARDAGRADVTTAPSRAAWTLASGESALPPRVTPVLVPMPVPVEGPAPTAAGDNPPLVVLVGRLELRKGPDILVSAAAILAESFPGLKVTMAGGDTREADGRWVSEILQEQAQRLGIPLDLPGRLSPGEISGLYARCRVVVVPSRYEPYSMVCLEALAAGRPVVISDGCGAAEHLGPAAGAVTFPTGDAQACAVALAPFLRDEALATSYGRRGRTHVLAHHTPAAAAAAKLGVWLEAIAAKRGGS